MVPVVGPFLLVGLVAWVAAIAMGVGAWFGVVSWRERWSVVGALAGLGTFELYLYAHGGALPVLVFDPRFALPVTAALFVGGGVAAAYGTLFVPGGEPRPALAAGSAEEALWLADTADRLRVRPRDWLLTGVLVLPGAGLLSLAGLAPAGAVLGLAGAAALAGPGFALLGLVLRGRAARRHRDELEARPAPERVAGAPATLSAASPGPGGSAAPAP